MVVFDSRNLRIICCYCGEKFTIGTLKNYLSNLPEIIKFRNERIGYFITAHSIKHGDW